MKDLTKVFIDLRKCSEYERKDIARIVNQNGHSITSKANYEMSNGNYDELFPLLTFHEYWYCSRYASGKTELLYPDFIKLFEGGEGENNGWIKIESEADLPTIGEYYTIANFDNLIVERTFPHPKFSLEFNKEWWLKYITHYQPITKPEPPKF